MSKLPNLEHTYSQEVDEILGIIPPRVIRVGITIIFLILSAILIGSYYFKYPRMVSAPVTLTTLNSPAPLVSRIGGRIDKWFVSDGEIIESGSPVAQLQSTTNYDDIRLIQSKLFELTPNWEANIKNADFPQGVVLGDVQDAYLNFVSAFNTLKHFIEENSISHKLQFKEKLVELNRARYHLNIKQKSVKEKQFQIARHFFSQDSLLFEQNKFGIPRREYDLSLIAILQEEENLLAFNASLKSLESSTVQLQQEIIELKIAHVDQLNEYTSLAFEYKQLLENKINSWLESFVLISPITGEVTLTKFWSPNQVVAPGQSLATIIPLKDIVIIGHAFISSEQLGQVEVGQNVNIKLGGFPFMQYGYINGKVKSISLVPEEKGYVVEIELPDGMVSSYSERLKFVHDMEGVAEMKVKDARLISRLLNY